MTGRAYPGISEVPAFAAPYMAGDSDGQSALSSKCLQMHSLQVTEKIEMVCYPFRSEVPLLRRHTWQELGAKGCAVETPRVVECMQSHQYRASGSALSWLGKMLLCAGPDRKSTT